MDATIVAFLLQDGVTSGAIYALIALALVLVFAVTRILFIPQGEFVAFGALTYAVLGAGQIPGAVWLLLGFGVAAFSVDLIDLRRNFSAALALRAFAADVLLPAAVIAIVFLSGPARSNPLIAAILAVAIVTPIGPYLYRVAFQPMAEASILTLFIAAVAIHFALTGLLLVFFGPEGLRAVPLSSAGYEFGPLLVSAQNLWVYAFATITAAALLLFFTYTLWGKALMATAINRLGARLVGIPTRISGQISCGLAAAIGAVSGVLIAPTTTVYYDTGFLIGLKGFVAAIVAGLASFPGAALAGVGVGVIEAFASFLASEYKEIIVFMMILPVLLWRSLVSGHAATDEE
ncbi:branched-chain amino acid ABC transporter permease [Terrarubrum flagellatum]|uniref:branched-chain amino acid ABC transporter permease n=1 Tax=Terrirubrum flagellatum TaxID=2895980 RepID=UPI0031452288